MKYALPVKYYGLTYICYPFPVATYLFSDVAAITAWLDDSNEDSPHENAMRVMKLAEEIGEAVEAYIGMVGQNPRKGVTHTRADLLNELADVAVTALCAMQHFTRDETATAGLVYAKLSAIKKRAGIEKMWQSILHYSRHGNGSICGEAGFATDRVEEATCQECRDRVYGVPAPEVAR